MSLPNTIGSSFAFTCFGESHGKCIGVVIDGCPAGLELAESDIQKLLDLRKPGQSIVTTQRNEQDKVEILSGVFMDRTTGAPICLLIRNSDQRSSDYDKFLSIPRPGHADYPAFVKYSKLNDYRGGGRFSGRITAGFVMAGSVALKLLENSLGVRIIAFTQELGGLKADVSNLSFEEIRETRYLNEVRCPEGVTAEKMKALVVRERGSGDSLGGIVQCNIVNVPVGLGEPVFSSIESELSRAIFSIPAVKGIEFGSGFSGSKRKGSENNDIYSKSADGKIITKTNNSGGVLGGLSTGMPIVFRVAFKPASSIALPQRTLDFSTMEEKELVVPGRHDPTVVPRAVPVVESMAACVIADLAIKGGYVARVLN
ncbi:MAG TPA: chorismate synthase [Nitrososphaerales archaeon]|nr:chorismate synthase [Nitrososphaerales archaeon]